MIIKFSWLVIDANIEVWQKNTYFQHGYLYFYFYRKVLIKEGVQENTRSPTLYLAFKVLLVKKKIQFFHIPCLIDHIAEIFFGSVGRYLS